MSFSIDDAQQMLESLLGHLGFVAQIKLEETEEGPCFQIHAEDHERLIGRRGETLDDLQYLLNRLVLKRYPDAPRLRVDVEYHRLMQEDKMLQKVREMANRVRQTGQDVKLSPMNSYYRRLIHHTFKKDPEVESISASGSHRFKEITLRRRTQAIE